MNDAERILEKRQRLMASLLQNSQTTTESTAPSEQGGAASAYAANTSATTDRLALLEEIQQRIKASESEPIVDPSGVWSEEEIFPGGQQSDSAERDDATSTENQSQANNAKHQSNDSNKEDGQNPLASFLRLLFPQLDAAAMAEVQQKFQQFMPHFAGLQANDLAQWLDPKTFESFWKSIPGMSQIVNILREGPAQSQSREKQARHSPLVVIQEGSKTRTPFFCVHAILGSTFHYHRLARLMDADLPFYALQAQGLDPREEPLDRIEDFAHRYLQEIKRVQPHGPYALGGYSFGSWVAFEIAQELARTGEEVHHLVLIGAGLPVSMHAPALSANTGFTQKYFNDFRKMLLEPFLTYEERLSGGLDGWFDRFLTPLQRVYRAHFQAVMAYLPTTFPGRFLLMETIEQRAVDAAIALGGWDRLAQQGVESVLISGNHLSMLEEPHIHEVAKHLNQYLKPHPSTR